VFGGLQVILCDTILNVGNIPDFTEPFFIFLVDLSRTNLLPGVTAFDSITHIPGPSRIQLYEMKTGTSLKHCADLTHCQFARDLFKFTVAIARTQPSEITPFRPALLVLGMELSHL
tara:strand:- start:187 stop:534 length:348 start_codon:yes stop_codon:yes gene_type:complete